MNDITRDELRETLGVRISASETRLKFWFMGGLVANMLIIAGGGIPIVYYLGQISVQAEQAIKMVNEDHKELDARSRWMRERRMWESDVESHLQRSSDYRIKPELAIERRKNR